MPVQPVSFKRHRFPPDAIRLAVWLYFRFTLSFRDVEEMLSQRVWSFDDGSANNRGSSLNGQRKDFSRLTPRSTTTSTFKDT